MPKFKVSFAALVAATAVILGATAMQPASAEVVSRDCTKYVSKTGSDSAAGTETSPWLTIQPSLDKLSAGDTLCIRAGTYAEELYDVSLPVGTATSRITIRNYQDERVVIDGAATFANPMYWTFAGMEWTNPTPISDQLKHRRIVAIVGGTNWEFVDNQVYDSTYAGMLVGKSSVHGAPHDSVIRDNVMYDTDAANLYFNPGRDSTGMLIERNLFFNSETENVKLGWGGNDVCTGSNYEKFGIGEVTFRYNTLHNSWQGLVIAEPGGLHRVDVYRNLMTGGTRGYAVRYDSNEGCLGDKVYVYDNAAGLTDKFSEDFGASPVNKSHEFDNLFPIDPQYDSLTATGFRPTNTEAYGYGKYADTTDPVVDITGPRDGSTVSGTIDITAEAGDDVELESVSFYRGTTLLGTDITRPYTYTWDTTDSTNGSYVLTAKARDTTGNTAISNGVNVTVSN